MCAKDLCTSYYGIFIYIEARLKFVEDYDGVCAAAFSASIESEAMYRFILENYEAVWIYIYSEVLIRLEVNEEKLYGRVNYKLSYNDGRSFLLINFFHFHANAGLLARNWIHNPGILSSVKFIESNRIDLIEYRFHG